jgi:signal transduction histidine kinase
MTSLHDRTARLREAVVPGWLAEAMPDWLTQAVRPKPAPVPWGAMVRAALAICVPLAAGIVAGRRDLGLVAAIGGLTGTVIDTGGAYLVRVKQVITAAVLGGAVGLVLGMVIHHRGWVAVASLVVVAGVSALISRLGSTGSATGLQLLVFTALGLGPFGGLRPWWHIVLGFVAAVAGAYHALAGDLRAIGTDRTAQTRRAVTTALNTAYDTLLTARATAGGRSRRMTHLMAVLNASSRVAEAVVTLRREGARPLPLVADTLDRLADAIAAGGPLPATPPARPPEPAPRTPLRERARAALGTLLDQLRGGRLAWTFTIRLMVCVGVAAVASEVLPLQRSYWVVLTVAIVVKPDYGSVFARAVQRGIGTIAGAVLGAVILAAVPYGPWLLVPMAVLAAGRPYGRLRNYGLVTTFQTPLVVLLIDLLAPAGWRLPEERLADTLLGCAIVLLVGYASWPSSWHAHLPAQFAATLRDICPYFAGADCCSLLAVPILSRGTLRAVLLLENRLLAGAFTAGRLEAVKLIAGQLAVSLDNAQLYAGFREVAGEQAALRRVAMLVARAAPPEAVFAAVAGEVGRLLGVDVAVLVRYDPRDSITVVGAWTSTGAAPPTPVGSQFPLGGNNASTLVFRTGQTGRTDQAGMSGAIGDVATRDWGLQSSVGVPIRVEGRLWGAMIVALTRGELLPAEAEARLAGFTELVATAIANMQARVELQGSADEQAALRRVAELVARAAPPEEVFAAVTAEAGRLHMADLAFLNRYAPDGIGAFVGAWAAPGGPAVAVGARLPLGGRNVTSLVFQTGRSARIDRFANASGPFGDFAREAGVRASVGVPISVAGRLWGVMILSSRSEPLPAHTESRLAGFTELVATAIANTQAQAEVAASRARILTAGDETRRRIERDLHDGVQQRLVVQTLMLGRLRDQVPADLRADVDEVRDELAATREELRDLSQGVHPTILVEAGLEAAIRALARRSPLPVRVQLRAGGRLPGSCEITAYYVAAEAFTNAAKHANASAVDILIEKTGGTLTVQVRDDGAGGADASRGSGLTGLRDRVEAVGGSMTVDSPAGAGTVLTVQLPITQDDH